MTNLKLYSPFNNSLINELSLQRENEVESYLAIAHQLHKKNPQGLPAYQRIEILEKTAEILSQKSEELITKRYCFLPETRRGLGDITKI